MKKLSILFLAVSIVLILAACGGTSSGLRISGASAAQVSAIVDTFNSLGIEPIRAEPVDISADLEDDPLAADMAAAIFDGLAVYTVICADDNEYGLVLETENFTVILITDAEDGSPLYGSLADILGFDFDGLFDGFSSSEEPAPIAYEKASAGDIATLGDWEITIHEKVLTDRIEGQFRTFSSAHHDEYFVLVYMSVKNNGTEASSPFGLFGGLSAAIRYQDTFSYSHMTISVETDDLTHMSIPPLATRDGFLAFSLPAEVAQSDALAFALSLSGNGFVFELPQSVSGAAGAANRDNGIGDFNRLTIGEFEDQYNAMLAELGVPRRVGFERVRDGALIWDGFGSYEVVVSLDHGTPLLYVYTEDDIIVHFTIRTEDSFDEQHALYYLAAILVLEGRSPVNIDAELAVIFGMSEAAFYDDGALVRAFWRDYWHDNYFDRTHYYYSYSIFASHLQI